MSLIAPQQTRSIDPFSEERFTSCINRMTRIFTGGNDYLLFEGESFLFDMGDSTSSTYVGFSSGLAIKDDVVLNVIEDGAGVEFLDDDYYLDEIPGPISSGWYYIVLYYNYSRSYPAPKAYYRILRDTSIFQTYQSNYLFLAAVYLRLEDKLICTEDDTDWATEDDQEIMIESDLPYFYYIDDMEYYDPTNPDVGKRLWLNISWVSGSDHLLATEDADFISEE